MRACRERESIRSWYGWNVQASELSGMGMEEVLICWHWLRTPDTMLVPRGQRDDDQPPGLQIIPVASCNSIAQSQGPGLVALLPAAR
jgi:hypothetical protein